MSWSFVLVVVPLARWSTTLWQWWHGPMPLVALILRRIIIIPFWRQQNDNVILLLVNMSSRNFIADMLCRIWLCSAGEKNDVGPKLRWAYHHPRLAMMQIRRIPWEFCGRLCILAVGWAATSCGHDRLRRHMGRWARYYYVYDNVIVMQCHCRTHAPIYPRK